METLVEKIEKAKQDLKEIENEEKELLKERAAWEQRYDNTVKNKTVYERILDSLIIIRDNEIQAVLAEPVKKVEETNKIEAEKAETEIKTEKRTIKGKIPEIAVCAIDEHGEHLAEYRSYSAAAKDLDIQQATVSYRINQVPVERQISKYGYALIRK